ncbi:acetyl-CoA C-acyltransferase [Candidatus Thioglobus sp.]|jgi:acetyl-CoA acyltransferase|uniref:acetyl-CoA C-acyltransferase n=1 Tax=Candidatus Thioglobus sp. TaxID=2026721 RepID=UPI001D860284|nr:acetyl-CoA C-acyltransferase [Candidatus Thioglobus sp.]MBT3186374.1 acetyl-CoA C-acyltransferase [Candidatus Thioglobus sp.]MBT3431289.1 acetyl-CoA C-acyltransferase [Candidatus Thioglobus sp.]MBT3964883.1 acetyl-CoA C-acyltransferase [Candidatus Thioglobus sp.]MBT4315611.1 acetyl-CoA C-acyltransferase [Candidatus Thioglobus sp.]MBT4923829.1 acetyl-CoA C-acyltransferase [Candidatus Thioglobus sp.]
MTQDAYIASAIRTPTGKAKGVFKQVRPDDLLSFILKTLLEDNPSVDPKMIDDVIIGCAMPEAEQGLNIARISALLAGYPNSVAGVTVNRFCASGLQSIAYAADRIRLGEADVVIAGGVESMSMIPMTGHHPAFNMKVFNEDNLGIAYGMGTTAEQVVKKYNIKRGAQDQFAFESHQKAISAINQGYFEDEIRPYETIVQSYDSDSKQIIQKSVTVSQDEGVRFDTSIEQLSKLKGAFHVNGSVTAGNSSQMSDGASAVLLCSEKALKLFNLEPMARFVGFAVSGVDPKIMGIGPVLAIPKVLKQCGLKQYDIGHIELNEAFAAQSLAVIQELNLDPNVINPLGGAIALGHPLGATGSIRTSTLVHNLNRTDARFGMVTMCIGSGMGAAGVFENSQ